MLPRLALALTLAAGPALAAEEIVAFLDTATTGMPPVVLLSSRCPVQPAGDRRTWRNADVLMRGAPGGRLSACYVVEGDGIRICAIGMVRTTPDRCTVVRDRGR